MNLCHIFFRYFLGIPGEQARVCGLGIVRRAVAGQMLYKFEYSEQKFK